MILELYIDGTLRKRSTVDIAHTYEEPLIGHLIREQIVKDIVLGWKTNKILSTEIAKCQHYEIIQQMQSFTEEI